MYLFPPHPNGGTGRVRPQKDLQGFLFSLCFEGTFNLFHEI